METTLIPAAPTLPACVTACGHLYDVNGACVPPAAPTADASTYISCFCNNPDLAPFKSGTAGVCDNACADVADLSSIQSWFTSFCASPDVVSNTDAAGSTTSASSRPVVKGSNGGGGQTWLEGHYQWVIFLVIMVVAIVGIWVGACVWRRRYLRKKDRMFALGTNQTRATESGRIVPNNGSAGSVHAPAAGMFDPAPITSAGVYGEKPKKAKKWTLRDRD